MKSFISFFSIVIFSSLFKYNNDLCNDHCIDCSVLVICSSCEDHYYLNWYKSCDECYSVCKTCKDSPDECTSCYDGYYLSNKKCLKCNSNCKACSNSANHCLSCDKGYYLISGNKCNKCPNTCNTCNNENKCLTCLMDIF